MVDIDWNTLMKDAQGQAQPVPVGMYNVIVKTAQSAMSSTGKPMIRVKYMIEDGPHMGRHISTQFVISRENGTALGIFFRQMDAHGFDSNFFAANPSFEQLAANMEGRRVQIKAGHNTYQGVTRNSVDNVMPPLGAPNVAPTGVGNVLMPVGNMASSQASGPQPQMPAASSPTLASVAPTSEYEAATGQALSQPQPQMPKSAAPTLPF